MGGKIPLPDRAEVRKLLAGLLGEVTVEVVAAPPDAATDSVSLYVDDNGEVVSLCVGSLGFATAAGAAIALVPPNVAAEARTEGVLTRSLAENLREVMNILATLLCSEESPHVKFCGLHPTRSTLPVEIREFAANATCRLDLNVALGEYGEGTLTLLAA